MSIVNNIAALRAVNDTKENQLNTTKTMEKLASGKRVNRAADDVSGLTISQKMKAQIRGLEQASRNIQEGIDLANTAEGGLSVIENPNLQRMRELVIQAKNDTVSAADRKEIQKEIDQIKRGINDIAKGTEYNTKKVLAPPKIEKPASDGESGNKVDIVFFIDDSGTMQQEIDQVRSGIDQFVEDLSEYGDAKVATTSVVHEGRTMDFTGDTAKIQNHLKETHVSTVGNTSTYQKMVDYAPGNEELSYREDSSKIYVTLTDTFDESSLETTEADVKNTLEKDGIYSYVFGVNFASKDDSVNKFNDKEAYDDFADEIYAPESAEDIATAITPGLSDQIIKDTGLDNEVEKAYKPVILQVGPHAEDEFTMELFDARTPNLGIDKITVDPIEKAEEALLKLDKAIQTVSSERGKFGAYTNALEHIDLNVTNYSANMTGALSRIEDADMAKQTMEQVKNQILQDTSQAMIAKANQSNQNVLQLLKT